MDKTDDAPRKPVAHDIGQKLDDLSVGDFDDRINVLRTEIERLEVAKRQKQEALAAAGSVFRSS